MRNESFVSADAYETCEGRLLLKFSKSRYLDFVSTATFASDVFPGPLQHWGVACLNHIIEVVAAEAPTLTVQTGLSG